MDAARPASRGGRRRGVLRLPPRQVLSPGRLRRPSRTPRQRDPEDAGALVGFEGRGPLPRRAAAGPLYCPAAQAALLREFTAGLSRRCFRCCCPPCRTPRRRADALPPRRRGQRGERGQRDVRVAKANFSGPLGESLKKGSRASEARARLRTASHHRHTPPLCFAGIDLLSRPGPGQASRPAGRGPVPGPPPHRGEGLPLMLPHLRGPRHSSVIVGRKPARRRTHR